MPDRAPPLSEAYLLYMLIDPWEDHFGIYSFNSLWSTEFYDMHKKGMQWDNGHQGNIGKKYSHICFELNNIRKDVVLTSTTPSTT